MNDEIDERRLEIHAPKSAAAGLTGVKVALLPASPTWVSGTPRRRSSRLNQSDGFDCMSCAWPDLEHRHIAEFCENGAKAVAEEATRTRATPAFFAEHSIAELDARDEYWLGQQGRITHPMVKRPGGRHYEEIAWDEAYDLVAHHLRELGSPDEALFPATRTDRRLGRHSPASPCVSPAMAPSRPTTSF